MVQEEDQCLEEDNQVKPITIEDLSCYAVRKQEQLLEFPTQE
jgi:hypothetical protein